MSQSSLQTPAYFQCRVSALPQGSVSIFPLHQETGGGETRTERRSERRTARRGLKGGRGNQDVGQSVVCVCVYSDWNREGSGKISRGTTR